MSTPDEEATISIPSIAFVAVLGFLLYRYFFATSTSSPSSSSSSSTSTRGGPRFTAAQVDQVAQMFPQLNRRDIMWDLHRNRGSVAATTERILMGGRLEPAPPTFQPNLPPQPSTSTSTSSSPFPIPATAKINIEPDLITRYNLKDRIDVSGKGKGREVEEPEKNYGWASSKDARQAMLQRRRDEMILAARRKMQEKDAGAGAGAGAAVDSPGVEPVSGS